MLLISEEKNLSREVKEQVRESFAILARNLLLGQKGKQ